MKSKKIFFLLSILLSMVGTKALVRALVTMLDQVLLRLTLPLFFEMA